MPAPDILTVFAHVAFGTIAVIMGAVALAARKGRKIHVGAGHVFVITMGLSSVLGAILGAARYETMWITFHAGILGATLVSSGVLAARIHAGAAKRWFTAIACINALNAACLCVAGWYASQQPDARLFGFPAGDYFFLCAMAGVASIADGLILSRAQMTDKHRIAQHLSRMCTGFFIAAGSAFTGPGASAFPEAVRNSGLLSLPEFLIVLLLLFWLWKTLRPRRYRRDTVQISGSRNSTSPVKHR